MKKQLATIITSVAAVMVLTAVSANAQSERNMTVDVPFEFVIAGETYGAGKYTIGRFNAQKPEILILKKKEGGEKKVFLTQKMKSKTGVENAHLVFSISGDSYSLSEIWTGGGEGGQQTVKSKSERKAQLRAKQEKMVLAASLQ